MCKSAGLLAEEIGLGEEFLYCSGQYLYISHSFIIEKGKIPLLWWKQLLGSAGEWCVGVGVPQ